ncbi:murein hydrolase activator EnvC [Cellvibrio sp. pealriver]|uniref:murein hydrolase activator EnvC family protein n=1 Tax=Cellvibrio sp. pealriver TaxID=1622269 RepID=UPI00066FC59D|nr:peptidoglycan DD-metalloendopeptidase family protein [Cellvibrio sp. pealriver]
MKRFLILTKTFFACSLLTFALSGVYAQADEKAEMAKLQKEIEALQKELKEVQGTRSTLQKDLEKSEKQINELQKKANDINKQLKEQNNELNQLKNERSQLEQARQQQQAQIAEQMRAAHKLGEQSEVKVLLNQESPDQVSRIMKYHSYFMEAHNQKMRTYLDTITRIDALTPEIEKKTLELGAMQTELDAQRAQLKNVHQTRQQALAKVNSELKNKNQELKQLSEDRRRLQALLERVTSRVATTGAINSPGYVPLPKGGEKFSLRKGRLPWPTQGSMTHRFGSPRIAGQMNWNGAYIAAPMGNSVVAVHHGRVVFADYFGGHGLLVIVDHGEGFLSLYAHNQSLLKKAGEPVSAGEAIAHVGNSGGQAGTGLYFEIRHNGKPIDPGNWLARS